MRKANYSRLKKKIQQRESWIGATKKEVAGQEGRTEPTGGMRQEWGGREGGSDGRGGNEWNWNGFLKRDRRECVGGVCVVVSTGVCQGGSYLPASR